MMGWEDSRIARLRALWAEGLSTGKIAEAMGISKGAVVGKAHRLNLPPRPSPIKRFEEGERVVVAKPERLSAPPGPGATRRVPEMAAVRAMVPAPRLRTMRPTPCAWPIGEPGKPSFHFCNASSVPGRPYCEEHAAIAYVRVSDRREDAA